MEAVLYSLHPIKARDGYNTATTNAKSWLAASCWSSVRPTNPICTWEIGPLKSPRPLKTFTICARTQTISVRSSRRLYERPVTYLGVCYNVIALTQFTLGTDTLDGAQVSDLFLEVLAPPSLSRSTLNAQFLLIVQYFIPHLCLFTSIVTSFSRYRCALAIPLRLASTATAAAQELCSHIYIGIPLQ